jgi:hypothetical protein
MKHLLREVFLTRTFPPLCWILLAVLWLTGQASFARATELLRPESTPLTALPTLSPQQMREDYDRLVGILDQVFPLREANRLVYGVDVRQLLAENRKRLQDTRTTEQFAQLINATIVSCRGNHFYFGCSAATPNDYFKGFVAEEAYRFAPAYRACLAHVQEANGLNLPLLCYEGNYYTLHDFTNKGTTYARGLKVVECNGKTPDAIVDALTNAGVLLNWDYDLKKFYTASFYKYCPLSNTNTLPVMFQKADGTTFEAALAANEDVVYQKPATARRLMVTLLNSNILYIRLPLMDPKLGEFWSRELPKYRTAPIRKVVVDIRNNPGGGDPAWFSLLKLLVKDSLRQHLKLAVKDSPLTHEYLARSPLSGMNQYGGKEKISFLNNEEFKTVEWSSPMPPETNSLQLTCKIYVLSENVYSAAGNLVHFCAHNDQLVSVGLPSGMALGQGTLPYAFSLPNSKLIFTLEPVLDLTDAKTARDTHHVDLKVRVRPTLHQMLDYYNTGDEVDLEKRLNQHDPLFQKVLELE